ncbi:MAG: LacI family DNA-binding transcriptional regulator, partial [Pseudomonadota bacterium]
MTTSASEAMVLPVRGARPADGAGVHRLILGQCALAIPGEDDGDAEPLDKPLKRGRRIGGDRAAARHDAGSLSVQQQLDGRLDNVALGALTAGGQALGQVLQIDIRLRRLNVERDVHMHRTRAARGRGEGAMATKVTLRDVAAAAGVAEPTASRALAGSGQLSEETRRRIADA